MCRNLNKLLIALMLVTGILTAQESTYSNLMPEPDLPVFYADAISHPLATQDSVMVEIFLKVPFDNLQFVKQQDQFVAKYEVSMILVNSAEIQAYSRIWRQELKTDSYEQTNSKEHFDMSHLNFKVIPDDYVLTISIMDLDTRKSSIRKLNVNSRGFYHKPITLSQINIIEKVVEDQVGEIKQVPTVMNAVSDVNPYFYIAFDILSKGGSGTISYSIYDMKKKLVIEEKLQREFVSGISHELIEISKEKLGFSRFRLRLMVKIGKNEVVEERAFQLRWLGMSTLIDNLEEAIDQLRYIASSGEIREMRKGERVDMKSKYLDFWTGRDPTPNTPENELMNEYYRRVQYSNEHFSGFQPGWRTDMGMIFILFGPPNDVERHPFDLQTKPYEIWSYYQINRVFVFVDESGFGEYRLISPIYDLQGRFF
jgi:GWxTD domain-containing protein